MSSISSIDIADVLPSRLVEFVGALRRNGFRAGVAEELDAQRTALICGITDHRRLRWGLKSLLCSSHGDWERFDEIFDAYWLPARTSTRYRSATGAPVSREASQLDEERHATSLSAQADQIPGEGGEDASNEGVRKGASTQERRERADFRLLAESGGMREIEALVERLARNMRRRRRRREKITRHGRRIHLRGSLRKSLRFGGTPLELAYRQRCKRQPRLVLVVDVSRSMSMYSLVFLRFARALVNIFDGAETFACHTRLVHISQAMRQTDLEKMQKRLVTISRGWAGGTRIGDSLEHLNRRYGRMINARTVVVIVSDGLDTGEPEHLAAELERIKARCRKLVWLNPLLGREGYEPRTAGMLAALPFIDMFAPAHNLQSLMALEQALTRL
ncbi:MAG: VWA domain-containing protein [Arenicellales bacterium]